ncbi:MAG: pyrroloquinoline quinone biosynthesis protein PqqE [Methanobacterium sp. PtaU1.Bin097]|nr:MAG: pyrroloquinoline quinone biosynthesis protein PqqE [Methanobacterium sp. PtaU1.Bin097]
MSTVTQSTQTGHQNGLNIGDMITTFKGIADNPVSKYLLSRTLDYCEADGANRLEVCLDLYLGNRETACRKCKIVSKFVNYIINTGASSFGVSQEELKTTMEDKYWAKGLSSVIKGIAIFGVKKPFTPGAPFQVVWNLSRACNMKCVHCYENAGRKDEDELNTQQINDGLETMAKAGVTSIAFSGGEPSIHPHILDFIDKTNELGMFAAMATNGYTLSKEGVCEKFVENGLQFVQISVDGLQAETHDSFRGINGAWDKAIHAVENCVNYNDLFVEVATTVTEHNIQEIPEMIDFIRDKGVDWFMIYNFIPTGNGENIASMDISPKKRLKLLETAYDENAEGEMQVLSTAPQYAMVAESLVSDGNQVIPTHFYNPEYDGFLIKQLADFIGGCGAGRFYMSVEPNGDLYPCVFFPHDSALKLGNLMEDDFEEVWKDNQLLSKLRNKEILKGHCGDCESHNICGGCRARAYNYFGDILAPDPGCINNNKEWNKIRSHLPKETKQLNDGSLFIDLNSK